MDDIRNKVFYNIKLHPRDKMRFGIGYALENNIWENTPQNIYISLRINLRQLKIENGMH